MNSISSIALHVNASDELFVQNWYRDFELFAEKHITAVADRVLMRCDQYGFEIEVSKLDIDLGTIREEDFEKDFERLLEEKLEECLVREILYPSKKEDRRLEEADYQLEALKQFLLHGTLNWNLAKRFKNTTELFRQVLAKRAKELNAFLKSYGHFTSLQHRMIYQFEDTSLFETVKLLAPEEFSFVQSYVIFLRVKYAEVPKTPVREEERRIIIWKVVFAYLLSNQSSTFNKKLFVRDTIGNLASHVNLNYGELLKLLTFSLDQGFGNTFPSGLQVILQELKQEETRIRTEIDNLEEERKLALTDSRIQSFGDGYAHGQISRDVMSEEEYDSWRNSHLSVLNLALRARSNASADRAVPRTRSTGMRPHQAIRKAITDRFDENNS